MNKSNFIALSKGILSAYGQLGLKFAGIIALIIASGIASFAVAYPLWLFATTSPDNFTIVALTSMFILVVFIIVKKKIRNIKLTNKLLIQPKHTFFRRLKYFFFSLLFVAGGYLLFLLFTLSFNFLAILGVVIYVFLFGLFLYGRTKNT